MQHWDEMGSDKLLLFLKIQQATMNKTGPM